MNATEIMTADEIRRVLSDLRIRARRGPNAAINRTIFRLAIGCGLRRKEISLLNRNDVVVSGARPCIRVRKEATKGRDGKRRARLVPLWWDGDTLKDLADWMASSAVQGPTSGSDPFVFGTDGLRLSPAQISRRWRTAIKRLGPDRVQQLHVHCGRHTFASFAIQKHGLVAVSKALGHKNTTTTSVYLHLVEDATAKVGSLFTETP